MLYQAVVDSRATWATFQLKLEIYKKIHSKKISYFFPKKKLLYFGKWNLSLKNSTLNFFLTKIIIFQERTCKARESKNFFISGNGTFLCCSINEFFFSEIAPWTNTFSKLLFQKIIFLNCSLKKYIFKTAFSKNIFSNLLPQKMVSRLLPQRIHFKNFLKINFQNCFFEKIHF